MSQHGSKALWDLIALSGAEILGKLAGFIAFATLARLFSPEDYGSLELAISLLVFFATFVDFGLGPIGSREVARESSKAETFASLIPATRLLLVCLAFPMMLLSARLMNLPAETISLISIVSIGLVTMPFNQKWLLQGLERMTWVSVGQAIHMILFMLGVLIWVRHTPSLPLVAAIEVFAISATAAWFVTLQYRLSLPLRVNFDFQAIGNLLKQAFPVGSSLIVWAMNQNVPIFLIATLNSAVEVAWYAVAMRIVNALLSFSMIYHFNLYPSVVNRLQQSHEHFLALSNPSSRLCAWAGAAVALIGGLVSEPLVTIAFGDQYAEGSLSLTILVWIVPVMMLSSHAKWALVASNKQHYVLHSQLGGVCICIVACFLMVPAWGATGACFAVLLSSLGIWAISFYYARRWVAKIPFTSCIAPLSVAFALVSANLWLEQSNAWTILACIVIFFLAIPAFDRKLPSAIHTLIHIKNTSGHKHA